MRVIVVSIPIDLIDSQIWEVSEYRDFFAADFVKFVRISYELLWICAEEENCANYSFETNSIFFCDDKLNENMWERSWKVINILEYVIMWSVGW